MRPRLEQPRCIILGRSELVVARTATADSACTLATVGAPPRSWARGGGRNHLRLLYVRASARWDDEHVPQPPFVSFVLFLLDPLVRCRRQLDHAQPYPGSVCSDATALSPFVAINCRSNGVTVAVSVVRANGAEMGQLASKNQGEKREVVQVVTPTDKKHSQSTSSRGVPPSFLQVEEARQPALGAR